MNDSPRALDGLNLQGLLQAVTNQWKWIAAFAGGVLLAALVGSLVVTPKYEAKALIQLMPRAGQEMDGTAVVKNDDAGYLESRDRARTQIQIILSRSVREEVLARYNALGHDDIPATRDGVDALGQTLSAGPREDTQLVEIRVLHANADKAAVLANLTAEVYREGNLTARTDAARETRVWLEGQTSDYKGNLDEATTAVLEFKEANNLVDIDTNVDAISSRMDALQKALGEATSERAQLEGTLNEHERLLKAGSVGVLAGMLDDEALTTMTRERASIVTQTADVLARYGTAHPEHQRAVEHIARVDALIATEVERIIGEERAQLRSLRRQEAEINSELDTVKGELLEKQRLQESYADLKLDEDRARKLYANLGEREAEVDLQARSRLNDVRIVDPAVPPRKPATPNIPLNLAVGLLLGVGGGLGIALVRERFNDTIQHPSDVERHLDLPMLAVLPTLEGTMSDGERALYAYERPKSLAAEAFRGLRAMLVTFTGRAQSRCFLITSCVPGEGKTHGTVGLAVAFAQLGLSVVVVDADMRRPKQHTLFGVDPGPGLSDALQKHVNPVHFVQDTQVPRLFLLPAGTPVDNPNELLSSDDMRDLLTSLRENYQVILVDTAPAALTSDVMALAGTSEGVLMVVRRGVVDRALVTRTIEGLRRVKVKILGVALNDMPIAKKSVAYGSGYYSDERRVERPPVAPEPRSEEPRSEEPRAS